MKISICMLSGGFDTPQEQERGYSTTELGMDNCSTCGREAVKSVLRLFDELVKCDEEGVLKGVREVIEGN